MTYSTRVCDALVMMILHLDTSVVVHSILSTLAAHVRSQAGVACAGRDDNCSYATGPS